MREMMESESDRLGFRVIDSIEVMHRTKHQGERFKIHLMWFLGRRMQNHRNGTRRRCSKVLLLHGPSALPSSGVQRKVHP